MIIETLDNGIYLMDAAQLENNELYFQAYLSCSSYRRGKVDKLKFDKDKRLSLAVGILMNYGLEKYGLAEADMAYETTKEGKPTIVGRPDIFFNASHSGQYATVCFSDTPIGVDLQEFCKFNPNIAKRFFAESEYQAMMKLQEERQKERFFRLWALKEAYIKFTGRGMNQELDSFYFDFDTENNLDQSSFTDCYFKEYVPRVGYRMAVCIGMEPETLK